MTFYDKYGFPVGKIKGRSVVNFIRLILWTDIINTIKRRGCPLALDKPDHNTQCYLEPVLAMSTEDKPWMKFKGTLPIKEGTPQPLAEPLELIEVKK